MSKLNIYACSGVGEVNSTAQRVAKRIADSGWERNETLRKYLGTSKDGGCAEYFLYTFIPQEELGKYNAIIYQKRQQQLKTFAYVRELFVGYNYGTEEDMKAIIRKGIETTFGSSVEQVLAGIRNANSEGVGPIEWTAAAIAAIVTAIVSLIVTVVTGIIEYCKSVKVAQYTAPTFQEIEDSAPAATDFTSSSKKNAFALFAIAGAAILLIRKFKK